MSLVKINGLEPSTSCMSSKRSDQLSYTFILLYDYIIAKYKNQLFFARGRYFLKKYLKAGLRTKRGSARRDIRLIKTQKKRCFLLDMIKFM